MHQTVGQIMTGDVMTVKSRDTLETAARIMRDLDIGSIPVVDDGRCVGIITDRDIIIRAVAEGHDVSSSPVNDTMTRGIVTASPDMDIHEAARIMSDRQIRRLPVVQGDRLVGIVALGDLAIRNIYQNEAGDALSQISETDTH
ncbi:CBS domain-containing protein [Heliophilum fasciatum]|uniref:CBS domain-containing protein n=1 Tax=Heliophilum fasciatum TaxID=35700 RepID=A0A4R2RN01_9FIRM|nr:CBS domain-containing protein [Heliophilum fasciatum]MCW2278032.1 CBS domain-containing protein [Heliophilum fasciatum]TCP64348.1 CBS domain-containing protein [Heliophilum fasciatum]